MLSIIDWPQASIRGEVIFKVIQIMREHHVKFTEWRSATWNSYPSKREAEIYKAEKRPASHQSPLWSSYPLKHDLGSSE